MLNFNSIPRYCTIKNKPYPIFHASELVTQQDKAINIFKSTSIRMLSITE